MKKKIRDAFYGIKNLTFGEMGTVARFDPATDATYDVVKKHRQDTEARLDENEVMRRDWS